jgi:hypothetical protein
MDKNSDPTQFPPPAAPSDPDPIPAPNPSPVRTRRTMSAGHIVAIVVGCLILLPGLGMVVGGGFAVGAQVAATDDGYFEFTLDRLESDGVAIAATDIWLDGDSGDADWLLDWLDVDVRLQVTGARTTDDVFVGIARSDDVRRYLAGTSYAEIVEIEGRSPLYRTASGSRSIESPLDQDFWAESVSGAGVQELEWEARGGRWSVVVMNTDGSPVVTADVDAALKSGVLMPIAITLLASGALVTITAVVLIVVGARGRRSSERDAGDTRSDGSPFDPPSAEGTPTTMVSSVDQVG